jgi:hypothetical protein
MFGWLSPTPRCPVDTYEKAWTETRMMWLAERFGKERLLSATVVLPDARFFPDRYEGTARDASRLFGRMRDFMGVGPGTLELEVLTDAQFAKWARGADDTERDDGSVITLAESHLADAEPVMNHFLHRLARHLLANMPLDEDAADREGIADLLPVCVGLGVIAANATLHVATGNDGTMSWWGMATNSSLPSRVLGYALALFAFARGEERPAWSGALRPDAGEPLREGLRYLRKTNDTLFDLRLLNAVRPGPRAEEIAERLRKGTPSARLAALWEVRKFRLVGEEYLEPVMARLADRDPLIAAEAAIVLAEFGTTAGPASARLREAMFGSVVAVRTAAAWALGTLRANADAAVPDLCALLCERDRALFGWAAWALAAYAVPLDAGSTRRLAERMREALVDCDGWLIESIARAFVCAVPSAHDRVCEHFADDPELQKRALEALAEYDSPPGATARQRPEGIIPAPRSSRADRGDRQSPNDRAESGSGERSGS